MSDRIGAPGAPLIPPLPWALSALFLVDVPLFLRALCTAAAGWRPATLGSLLWVSGFLALVALRAPALPRRLHRMLARWGLPVALIVGGSAVATLWPVPVEGTGVVVVSGALALGLGVAVVALRRRSPWRPPEPIGPDATR
ncbi:MULTISPECIES: hypothetical protein [Actinomycetes]|uniref:Integral membrane protein n=1 Tax=Streptoalloteichus tenebrarius (strain ATCC 17920 / DSM 40477 / JCM 4838 / CBS 697.72 / NBRC 16177 / NCIMB 11028 / NRRL B-12390 / A12253. 1 / ISP 5477) TaxID=1933 RepID=A0ABT1HY43_STRSD|nr:hypothetical protein [Streptoalloteichus tenebrarius]MCP2260285.1 hypothetical protein [Streptoalloteichus tenebrarius]